MPYKDKDDESLPDNVKKLSDDEREQWVAVFNDEFQSCQDEGGEDCEGEAMTMANGVVKKAKRFLDTLKRWIEKLTSIIAPAQRAISISGIADASYGQLVAVDPYVWLNDVYAELGGSVFLIVSSKGKLYKVPVMVDENSAVTLGEWQLVSIEFTPRPDTTETEEETAYQANGVGEIDWSISIPASRSTIQRQADGRYRWVSVSCSAALNRVGCIDSTKLFDSFIEHAERTGEYPIRQFYHQGGSFKTGQADFLARDGFALITSGVYDDSDLARAEIKARQADPSYWGDSIGFNPDAVEISEVAEGISIPVYTRGILTEISTLPEDQAAAWFTNHTDLAEVKRMLQGKVFEAFVKLFNGDEEAAKGWLEGNVDATNRSIIEQGLVARSVDEQVVEPTPEPTKPTEIIIEQTVMDALLEQAETRMAESTKPITENVATLAAAIESLVKRFQDLETTLADHSTSIEQLSKTDDQKRQVWQADLPARSTVNVTYRPRQLPDEGDADIKPAQSAQVALNKLPSYPK